VLLKAAGLRRSVALVGRQAWLLVVAVGTANAANYFFHVVISRMMSPDEYGALGAVLALLVWLSVPFGAVQAAVAKRLAEGHLGPDAPDLDLSWKRSLRTVASIAVAVACGLGVLSPFIWQFFRLDSPITALLISVYVIPAALLAVLRGALQGMLRFKRLAALVSLPILVRLGAGVLLVGAGGGVAGAVAASVLAELTGILLALLLLGRGKLPRRPVTKDRDFLREVAPMTLGLGGMWLLIELDLMLARHFLSPEESGHYAAAGLLARAVLFLPGVVSMVALPYFSRTGPRGGTAYRWLLAASGAVLGVSVPLVLAFLVSGDRIVLLTYGERFGDAASLLMVMTLAMVAMSLANLELLFHIAAGSRIFVILWVAAAVEILAIAVMHKSPISIAWIAFATGWTVAGLGLLTARSVATVPLSRIASSTPLSFFPSRLPESNSKPEISLIIPTYNGGAGLLDRVISTADVLDRLEKSFEIIVVSDGSTDRSDRLLIEAAAPAQVLHYTRRQGKGVALRLGMGRARGRFVAFLDGDGDLDVEYLRGFLSRMDVCDPDLVVGSKRHPDSLVQYPNSRRLMSWLYQQLVHLLFGLNLSDTQTGMKLIRREVLDAVLPRVRERRFAFDLEFLVVARRLGYARIVEAPVRLDYNFASTISFGAVVRILVDTFIIYFRSYVLRSYDHFPHRYPIAGSLPEAAHETGT
jgi:O-antigen/teichoic acid export membrane protein